jgi:ketosteroid isomerase-like protein
MRGLTWLVLLVVAGTSAGYAQDDSEADVGSKIVAMEHVWAQAYVAKDPKALERMLDDAFVCVDSNGRLLTKEDAMMDVRTSTVLQILTESMAVHLHGDTAIVTGVFLMKGLEHGKPFTERDRFVDTWLYRNGQWVSIASLAMRVGS